MAALDLAETAAETRDTLRRLLPRLDGALLDAELPGATRMLIEDARGVARWCAAALSLAIGRAPDDRLGPPGRPAA